MVIGLIFMFAPIDLICKERCHDDQGTMVCVSHWGTDCREE